MYKSGKPGKPEKINKPLKKAAKSPTKMVKPLKKSMPKPMKMKRGM